MRLVFYGLVLLLMIIVASLSASCGKDDPTPPGPNPPSVSKVQIGSPAVVNTEYEWSPSDSLSDSKIAEPIAFPKKTTTYTVEALTKCGSATSTVEVKVFKKGQSGQLIEVK